MTQKGTRPMAATRKNASKPDDPRQAKTRAAIQTTQLVNRLHDFALGLNHVDIDPNRLRAIEILLRKSLPDLQSIQLETGEGGIHIHLGSDAKKV